MTRDKFEAWAREALPHALLQWSEALGGYYLGIESNAAWKAWQAAGQSVDRKAREDCAAICDKIAESYENTGQEWMTGVHSAKRCERAIMETISGQT